MTEELKKLEAEMSVLRERVNEARRHAGAMKVQDYTLKTTDGGQVKLSELFGGKKDLILIHNMGKKCPYCTLWADGFVGFTAHANNRAAFVLCSADDPATAKEFAASRGWPYRVVSGHGSTFTHDMGYEPKPGEFWPGVSTFHRAADGTISRVATAPFGPGDSFCPIWHMFDMLKDGPASWEPKYTY
jgi:predicted dithiol-disulfide oxidoreductase (DUF899 family)